VSVGSRAVLEELLGQMVLLRSEMGSLRAVSERVGVAWRCAPRCGRQSESDDTLSANEPEQGEPVVQRLKVNGPARHREQAGAAVCGASSWAAWTATVMGACVS
jgi:hypothetical protein